MCSDQYRVHLDVSCRFDIAFLAAIVKAYNSVCRRSRRSIILVVSAEEKAQISAVASGLRQTLLNDVVTRDTLPWRKLYTDASVCRLLYDVHFIVLECLPGVSILPIFVNVITFYKINC